MADGTPSFFSRGQPPGARRGQCPQDSHAIPTGSTAGGNHAGAHIDPSTLTRAAERGPQCPLPARTRTIPAASSRALDDLVVNRPDPHQRERLQGIPGTSPRVAAILCGAAAGGSTGLTRMEDRTGMASAGVRSSGAGPGALGGEARPPAAAHRRKSTAAGY